MNDATDLRRLLPESMFVRALRSPRHPGRAAALIGAAGVAGAVALALMAPEPAFGQATAATPSSTPSAPSARKAPVGDVIDGASLTSDAVLDALDPGAVRTRSLRIGGTKPSASASATAPVRASASLLVTFETNSAELTSSARRQLDIVGSALKNDRLAQYGFTVEGHADPRGNAQANEVLSQTRAHSVKQYLVATHGIAEARLRAEGKGDRELMNAANPVAPENRRVTFVTQGR